MYKLLRCHQQECEDEGIENLFFSKSGGRIELCDFHLMIFYKTQNMKHILSREEMINILVYKYNAFFTYIFPDNARKIPIVIRTNGVEFVEVPNDEPGNFIKYDNLNQSGIAWLYDNVVNKSYKGQRRNNGKM